MAGGRPTNAVRAARKLEEQAAEAADKILLEKRIAEKVRLKESGISKKNNASIENINLDQLEKKSIETTDFEANHNSNPDNIDNPNEENGFIKEQNEFVMPEFDENLERDAILKNDEDHFINSEEKIKYDPLAEDVEKHGYTNTSSTPPPALPNGQIPYEPIIPEQVIKVPPLIDPNSNINGNKNTGNTGNPIVNNGNPINPPQQPPQPKVTVNPDAGGMSNAQKRKNAEVLADVLIKNYVELVPVIPKKLSKVDMRKLERAEMNDTIDTNMEILDDGTTVKGFFTGINEQVDETFIITQPMQDEIREPLIEVLLENEVVVTPTQRLIIAVGRQVLQMGASTIQFMQINKNAMKDFERFHRENKESTTIANNSKKHSSQYAARKAQEAQDIQEESERMSRDDIERENEVQRRANEEIKKRDDSKNNASTEDSSEKINIDNVVGGKKVEDVDFTEIKTNKLKVDDILTVDNGGISITEEKN